MANNKRTIHLGLDYTQFTGGVQEVNRKMSLLDSQFKLSTEQAKNYGTEQDKLGVKQEYLASKIALQAQKVEEAKKAYEKASQTQGASEKQIDSLQKAYIKEQTALEKLKGSLSQTDTAMEKVEKSTGSFGEKLRNVASQLGLNSPLVDGLTSKFDGLNANLGACMALWAGIGAKLVGFAKDAAKTADELNTLSSVTNITTDELQKLQYASKYVDVSVDTMTGAITKLTSNMDKAKGGSKDLQEAFFRLRVSYKDQFGTLKDANEVFYKTIDSLGKIKNETERDALAMTIFGKSAKELNPLIEAGSQRLKELGVEAENLGLVMSEEQLGKAQKLQDQLDRMDQVLSGLKNNLGLAVIPAITALIEALSKIPAPVLSTITVLATVATTIVLIVKAIKEMSGTVGTIKTFFSGFNLAASKTTLIIMGIVAAVIALLTLIAVLANKGGQVEAAMSSVGNAVTGVSSQVQQAQNRSYQVRNNAMGTENFSGGRTWVGEAGPELVTLPSGSQITPADKTGGETNNYYITIDSRNVDEFNRMIEMAQQQRLALRRA